jgi:hypothetical protein
LGAINVQGENIKPALQQMIKFTTQDYVRYHTAADNLRKALNKSLQAAENKLKSLGAQETQIKNTESEEAKKKAAAQQQQPVNASFSFGDPSYSILEEASLRDTEFSFLMEADIVLPPALKSKALSVAQTIANGAKDENDISQKVNSLDLNGISAEFQTLYKNEVSAQATKIIQSKSKNPQGGEAEKTAEQKPADNKNQQPEQPKYETEQDKENARTANETDQAKQRVVLEVVKTFQSIVTAKMTVMEEVEKEYMRVLRGVINGLTGANTQMERNAENKRANNAQDRKEEEEHQRNLTATRRQGEQLKAINKANKEAESGKHGPVQNFFRGLFG